MIDSEINYNDNNDNKKKETSYQLVHRNLMTVDAGKHHQHQHNVHSSSSPSSSPPPPFSFKLPPDLAAKEPPERRGIARDEVRLLVINRKSYETEHSHFYRIAKFLRAGDLLVFNSSRTIPASLFGYGVSAGRTFAIEVRLSEHLPDDTWLALLLCQGAAAVGSSNGTDDNDDELPHGDPLRGMRIGFGHGLVATVYDGDKNISKLRRIRFSKSGTQLIELLYRLGQPIRYEYVSRPWDLDYYQTVYAREPGSAEMPSAGRAFTWKLLLGLRRHGIGTAYISLHAGLSSYMDDALDSQHPASEEEYFVKYATAELINKTHTQGGRVIAVGTTVVRTLESVSIDNGNVHAGHGYTRLHITANHKLKAVDGLLTGLHEPEASHLDLLTAFLPSEEIHKAYDQAIRRKYLWHEFGDLNLIL
jgi:S-adenosylmethionine:tRNA ribosyltransferase-isomerase